MSALVECVPNFSEGRDKANVEAVVAAAKAAGVTILDVEIDADHHRCVLSFVGAPERCLEACFQVAKKAQELIGTDPARTPDFGPNKIHPTAGAVAVGARRQIINFNPNLDISDLAAGKDIAKRLRASGGGLPCVRGKEIFLEKRNQVQISTVLTDYKTTSMNTVLGTAMR